MTLPSRFWSKVEKSNACWLWVGAIGKDGYGRFHLSGATLYPHRVSFEDLAGPIPEGLTLDHLCRVRNCVNPAHLEPVSQAVNSQRGKATVTHCPQGHPYDSANTRGWKGRRLCRECNRAACLRRYYARKGAL